MKLEDKPGVKPLIEQEDIFSSPESDDMRPKAKLYRGIGEVTDKDSNLKRIPLKFLKSTMREEMKKDDPNLYFMSQAMERTFIMRKKDFLLKANLNFTELLINYPGLRLPCVLKEEFSRLLGEDKTIPVLEKKLDKYFTSLLERPKRDPPGGTHLWRKTVKKMVELYGSSQYSKKVIGMIALCFHLAENSVMTSLCAFRKEEADHALSFVTLPKLVLLESQILESKADMWIQMEDQAFVQVENFYEGVLCVYALYYILNYEYDSQLKLLFEFFDTLLGNPQTTFSPELDLDEDC